MSTKLRASDSGAAPWVLSFVVFQAVVNRTEFKNTSFDFAQQ